MTFPIYPIKVRAPQLKNPLLYVAQYTRLSVYAHYCEWRRSSYDDIIIEYAISKAGRVTSSKVSRSDGFSRMTLHYTYRLATFRDAPGNVKIILPDLHNIFIYLFIINNTG